jgi:hypothetical protein
MLRSSSPVRDGSPGCDEAADDSPDDTVATIVAAVGYRCEHFVLPPRREKPGVSLAARIRYVIADLDAIWLIERLRALPTRSYMCCWAEVA